jgi:hypothetical protein
MVLLVLVPGAAMAAGFGPKYSPLGQKTSQGAPDWAGNATALRANASAGAGDGVCDGDCLTAQARDCTQDRPCLGGQAGNSTQFRNQTSGTNQVCDGDQDRVRARDGTGDRTAAQNGKRLALQDRLHKSRGR